MNARARTVTVIGGGPGGYVAALRAAAEGLEVRLVERDTLGGTCLNVGCIPSKALLQAAEQRRAAIESLPGLELTAGPVDLAALQEWKSGVVGRLRSGVAGLLRGAGVETIRGTGRLTGPGMVEVDGPDGSRRLNSDAVVLATGSEPSTLPSLPIDGIRVLSSTEALDLAALPERVVIVGAGYIGLELATALQGLGSQVTVLELADRVLPGIHAGAAGVVADALRAAGVDLRLEVRVEGDDGRHLHLRNGAGALEEIAADCVIVAVGRRPRSGDLGLETVGIEPDASGLLDVDTWSRTSADGVYAIGDLTSGPALAHRASAQGKLVAEHLAGGDLGFHPAGVPAVVYTAPEIATVGLTLEEAEATGQPAQEHRISFAANARALFHGDQRGAAYVVSDPTTQRILGIHLVGDGVGELIGAGAVALEMGAVLDDVGDTVFPHPTLSEVLLEAVEVARGRPLHVSASAARATQGGR
jgi:dihydrolipoamide dehydrogenase